MSSGEPEIDTDRGRRREAVEAAYQLQVRHGVIGMAKWTVYGIAFCSLCHWRFPWFRRQTLAGKAFLVSSFSIWGLVTNADAHLLDFEHKQRLTETEVRRRAREDLSSRGILPSETNIRRWVAVKKRELEEQQQAAEGGGGVGEGR